MIKAEVRYRNTIPTIQKDIEIEGSVGNIYYEAAFIIKAIVDASRERGVSEETIMNNLTAITGFALGNIPEE